MDRLNEENTGLTPKIVELKIGDEVVPAPKKEKKKTINKSKDETIKDLSNLLLAGSSILSVTVDECWQMSEIETMSIAKPLCNIMERYNLIEKVAGASDFGMLLTTLAIVIGPRAIKTVKNKKKKVKVDEKPKTEKPIDNSIGENREGTKTASDGTIDFTSIKAVSNFSNRGY